MRPGLFDSFAEMIEAISPRAIVCALESENLILTEDLACQRWVPPDEAASIVNLCRFVGASRDGTPVQFSAAPLPDRHLELYRKTVARLVAAGELPFSAKAEFENLVCRAESKHGFKALCS